MFIIGHDNILHLLLKMSQSPLSIYIHWPYCLSKCPYCDFNSHVAKTVDHDQWLEAYLKQIDAYQALINNRPIHSIFFGGGTPSLMEPFVVEKLIEKLNPQNVEITLEANPTSIEISKLKAFKNAGVNRISMGIQALNNVDLKFLGRTHSAKEALQGLETARSLFDNVSFDLIYARPHQTIDAWSQELRQALSYGTKHLSLYQLTIEDNTPFEIQYKKGRFQLPKDDLSTDLYLLTEKITQEHGLTQYEVSNYAKPSFESKHNLSYWHYQDYLGIGPGAHSRVTIDGEKWGIEQIKSPKTWLETQEEKRYLIDDVWIEKIMMGLRLKKGFKLDFSPTQSILQLVDLGLLQYENNTLSATNEGFLKLNSIIDYIFSSLHS